MNLIKQSILGLVTTSVLAFSASAALAQPMGGMGHHGMMGGSPMMMNYGLMHKEAEAIMPRLKLSAEQADLWKKAQAAMKAVHEKHAAAHTAFQQEMQTLAAKSDVPMRQLAEKMDAYHEAKRKEMLEAREACLKFDDSLKPAQRALLREAMMKHGQAAPHHRKAGRPQ